MDDFLIKNKEKISILLLIVVGIYILFGMLFRVFTTEIIIIPSFLVNCGLMLLLGLSGITNRKYLALPYPILALATSAEALIHNFSVRTSVVLSEYDWMGIMHCVSLILVLIAVVFWAFRPRDKKVGKYCALGALVLTVIYNAKEIYSYAFYITQDSDIESIRLMSRMIVLDVLYIIVLLLLAALIFADYAGRNSAKNV